jgi:hypothetical protein
VPGQVGDDVPTGQLAKLIAPCVVFSEHRHLRKLGLAPPTWRDAVQFAVDLARGVTGQRITGNLATLPFRREPKWSRSSAGRRASRRGSSAAPTAAAAAYVLRSPQRRQAVGSCVISVAEALMKEMERSAALQQRGIAGLCEILLAALPEPDVKQQAAIVLARHDEPLLAGEVQQRLLGLSPTTASPRSPRYGPPSATVPNLCSRAHRWHFGHGVAVLLKIYAHCIDGQADAANHRITDALAIAEPEPSSDEGDADSQPAA